MLSWLVKDFKKRVCNRRGSFVFWAGVIGTAVLIGGAATGVTLAATSASDKAKKQKGEAEQKARVEQERLDKLSQAPPAPTPEDAQAKAKEAEAKKRRLRSLAGGKTLLTSETPTLGGGGRTLLGG